MLLNRQNCNLRIQKKENALPNVTTKNSTDSINRTEDSKRVASSNLISNSESSPEPKRIKLVPTTAERNGNVILENNLRVSNLQENPNHLIFENGLKAFIETSIPGRIVVNSGEDLNSKSRKELARLVVDHLFQKYSINHIIRKEIFIKVTEEIVLAYPNERLSVYFMPGTPKTKSAPRTYNKGKLWSRYNNVKAKLGPQTEFDFSEADNANIEYTLSESEANDGTEQERLRASQYLKNNVGILEEQRNNWRLCKRERAAFLEPHSIFQYINLFPILRTQCRYELMLQDFHDRYEKQKDCLYTAWEYLSRAIIRIGIKRNQLPEDLLENPHGTDEYVLKYFPTLFNPGTLRNTKKKTNFRPSNQELVEAFILHVHDLGNFYEDIEARKNVILQRGDTLQPMIVIVGSEVQNISSIYMYINGMKYLMESSLQAVDVCFKIFHALNANYPSTGQQLWNFIQRYIYNIHTSVDNKSTSQEEVAADLSIAEPALKKLLWDGKSKKRNAN